TVNEDHAGYFSLKDRAVRASASWNVKECRPLRRCEQGIVVFPPRGGCAVRISFLLLVALGAAVAGPYLISRWNQVSSSGEAIKNVGFLSGESSFLSGLSGESGESDSLSGESSEAALRPSPARETAAVPQGPKVMDFAHLFRFDVGKDWVLANFPRVSTAPGDAGLQGFRTPLVTGPEVHDLAGSLTFYFDRNHALRRITFRGTTGDSNRFANWTAETFSLKLQPDKSLGTYRYQRLDRRGKVSDWLEIRPSRVVSRNQPRRRFNVDMALSRPESRGGPRLSWMQRAGGRGPSRGENSPR
ncbi:MAG: hypothetical protein N2C14_33955, partial [Planctomycetales bacterium]